MALNICLNFNINQSAGGMLLIYADFDKSPAKLLFKHHKLCEEGSSHIKKKEIKMKILQNSLYTCMSH